MASQVLSGASNPSYTNNTGQNVRIVINYMVGITISTPQGPYQNIGLSWGGVSASAPLVAIGRNLAFSNFEFNQNQSTAVGLAANNALSNSYNALLGITDGSLPTELMLAPGQTFSAVCGVHNIVVIPENG